MRWSAILEVSDRLRNRNLRRRQLDKRRDILAHSSCLEYPFLHHLSLTLPILALTLINLLFYSKKSESKAKDSVSYSEDFEDEKVFHWHKVLLTRC